VSLSDPYYQPCVYYFGATNFLVLAAAAVDRCDATSFSLDACSAQIMAAVSAEAFIDELAFYLAGLGRIGKGPELEQVGSILQQFEASHVQVTEKFHIASQLLPGEAFDPGKQPFQSFTQLIKLRNCLAHPKVNPKPPGWFSYFVSNQLVVQAPDTEFLYPNWMAQLQSKRCASWACRATVQIVLDLIGRIHEPCNKHGVPGIHEMLTSTWEWAKNDPRIWNAGGPADSPE